MTDGSLHGRFAGRLNNYCVITDAERDWKRATRAFCRGRGGRGGCAKDGSSWRASPAWVSGVAVGLALSVLPRTAKLVVLQMISDKKENLRAEVDATDESDGLQVEAIPFRQDDQPHPASKRNKHLRLSQPTNQHVNHHQSINCIASLYYWGLTLGNQNHPRLFHLTYQPRQKFKLALKVRHSVPKQSAALQPDA